MKQMKKLVRDRLALKKEHAEFVVNHKQRLKEDMIWIEGISEEQMKQLKDDPEINVSFERILLSQLLTVSRTY
jgi:hypothetical protein